MVFKYYFYKMLEILKFFLITILKYLSKLINTSLEFKFNLHLAFIYISSIMANVVCQFYLEGKCRYGDACRNHHVDPDESGERIQSNGK